MVVKTRPRPQDARPRVSVVVPCYNYGHFLPVCVRTILDQDGVDVDVLIVDDASPDGSDAVAHRLAAEDPRVRVIAHETNKGHIATYNEGLAAIDGEYVVLLSADDLLAPGSLALSAGLLRAHPEVGLVYGFAPVFSDVPPPARTAVRSWTIWTGPEWVEQICRRGGNPVSTPEAVVRTSLMRELVGYDARLPHSADFLLWLKAAARASVGRVNGADLAYYRVHGGNMHTEQFAGAATDIAERRRAFEIFLDDDGHRLPDPARLREIMRRALAREALVTANQVFEHGQVATSDEGADTLERLGALAEEILPGATGSRPGRAYQRQLTRAKNGQGPVVPPAVSTKVDQVIFHLRWRRWRRNGTLGAVRSI